MRRRPSLSLGFIARLLCVGTLVAAGCGNDRDDVGASARRDRDASAARSTLVQVPDVTGQTAEQARSDLEAEGLEPTLDPEPDDPSLCTVSDQDETGEVEEGTEVILTLECMVDVPDLSDEPADDALSRLEDLGLRARYETEPSDSSACKVEDQDVVDEAEPESEVVLSLLCKLPDTTGEDLGSAVSRLERLGYRTNHPSVGDPRACKVTSHRSEAEPGATVELDVDCGYGH